MDAHSFGFPFWFSCQKNVPSASSDPSFLRMIMTQVLRHAVAEPLSADFTVSRRAAVLAGLGVHLCGSVEAEGVEERCVGLEWDPGWGRMTVFNLARGNM